MLAHEYASVIRKWGNFTCKKFFYYIKNKNKKVIGLTYYFVSRQTPRVRVVILSLHIQ